MTESEAIKRQLFAYKALKANNQAFLVDTHRDAERIIKALEKQIPKKLINTCQYVSGCCPNCKKYISDWLEYNKFMCCPYCGQKLDWSEE